MNSLLDPIEVVQLELGTATTIAAVGITTGTALFRFTNPTKRLHVSVEVGWTPFEVGDFLATSTWQVNPLGKADAGTFLLQPVVAAGSLLPDSYEAETAAKEFEVACTFVTPEAPFEGTKRMIAIVRWEPEIPMNTEERSYWVARCKAWPLSEPLLLGPSE